MVATTTKATPASLANRGGSSAVDRFLTNKKDEAVPRSTHKIRFECPAPCGYSQGAVLGHASPSSRRMPHFTRTSSMLPLLSKKRKERGTRQGRNRGWTPEEPSREDRPYFPVLTKLTQSPWFWNFRGMVKVSHPPFLH